MDVPLSVPPAQDVLRPPYRGRGEPLEIGHIENLTTNFREAVDEVAELPGSGVTVITSSNMSGGHEALPPTSVTIVNLSTRPSRIMRWNNGGGWNERRPRHNCLHFHPAGCSNAGESEGLSNVIEVGLPREFARRVLDEAELRVGEDFAALECHFTYDPFLATLIRQLQRITPSRCPADDLLADCVARSLVLHLGKICAGRVVRSGVSAGRLSWRQMRLVREFVEDRLARSITLDELAAAAGLSSFHFSRIFRETTGETPYRWVLRLRADRAIERLREPHAASAELIASACGFADRRHLSRTLRSLYGKTIRELTGRLRA